jgi:hypothetical protein
LQIPDIRRHAFSRQPLAVDPATKTLFCELVGVIYKPHHQNVQVGGLEPAEEKHVKEFFQVDGFKNCAQPPYLREREELFGAKCP